MMRFLDTHHTSTQKQNSRKILSFLVEINYQLR